MAEAGLASHAAAAADDTALAELGALAEAAGAVVVDRVKRALGKRFDDARSAG